MSYEFYKALHFLGLMLVFLGIGGLFAPAMGPPAEGPARPSGARRLALVSHGVGMLFMLVAGFGMLAKLKLGFPAWVHPKLLIWLLLGLVVLIPRRAPALARPVWLVLPVLGVIAGALAIYKPF